MRIASIVAGPAPIASGKWKKCVGLDLARNNKMQLHKLRVGVVGVGPGGIGYDQHLPGWAKVPFAEVAALADISTDNLARAGSLLPNAKRFAAWQELVTSDDLDVIDICTPNRTHAEIALAALTHGKHVLCEKPLATSSAEVLQLQGAAQQSGRLLMTAQHLRFEPLSLQLKKMVEDGALGEVYYARAQWLRRRLVPGRATFIEKRLSGGGPGFDIGVHVLDLAYWFMGAPTPVSVTATTAAKLAHRTDLGGGWGDWDRAKFDVEDFAAGFVRFDNGAVLLLEASWLLFQPEAELVRLQCFGAHGGLVWPDGVIAGETDRIPWDKHLRDKAGNPAHHEAIYRFALAVRGGKPSPVPVEETLQVIRILEGLYRSAETKREVQLEVGP
jgi:predicted dehydrogenase